MDRALPWFAKQPLAVAAAVTVAALGVASVSAAVDPFARALALEHEGKVRVALSLLAGRSLTKEQAAHRDRLRVVVAALDASNAYARMGQYALAQSVLEAAAKPLEPVSELPLATLLYRREARIARAARRATDREAAAALADAASLAKAGKHADAAAAFKAVADAPAASVSEQLRSRARVGQLHEEAAAAMHHTSRLAGVGETLVTVGIWALYALMALGGVTLLYLLHRLVRRLPPRRETTLAVEDLGATPAERTAKSYVLARQLLAEIRAAGISGGRDDGVDEARDLDGSTLSAPLPRPADEGLAKFDALVRDETPVKLGPLSFSPRQIASLLIPFLQRRAQTELRGGLVTDGQHVSLTIERFEDGTPLPVAAWHVACDGTDAHARALSEMAARLAAADGASSISSDWQSLLEYRTAMDALDAAPSGTDRRRALEEVRDHLRRAVEHDQGNLLARFHLARVERQLGENPTAAEHFWFLDRLVRSASRGVGGVGVFLAAHPEMRYVARYNRAVALSKIEGWTNHNEAIDLLLVLGMELSGADDLDEIERLRLQMLTASAWSDALVFELEQLRETDPESNDPNARERRSQRQAARTARITEIRAWLDELSDRPGVRAERAWVRSYATTQNAYGRALYLAGRTDEAVAAFESAIAMTPDLADASVNLGAALFRTKPKRWQRRAEVTLRRGVELAPENEKALFLLGRVLADPQVRQFDEARQVLGRVTDNPWASFRVAELDADDGKFLVAARGAIQSLRVSKHVDVRSAKLVEWTLAAADGGAVDGVVVDAARAAARNLARFGNQKQQAQATKDLALLEGLKPRPAHDGAPPPAAQPAVTPAPAAPGRAP